MLFEKCIRVSYSGKHFYSTKSVVKIIKGQQITKLRLTELRGTLGYKRTTSKQRERESEMPQVQPLIRVPIPTLNEKKLVDNEL